VQLGSHAFVYIDPEEAEARRKRAGGGASGGDVDVDRSTEDVEWVSQWEQRTRTNARAHWRRRSEALAAAAAGGDGVGAQALPDWWTTQRRSMRHKLSRLLQAHARPQYDQYMADLMQTHKVQTAELQGRLAAQEGMELQFRLRERMLQAAAATTTTGDAARSVVESTSGFMLRKMAAATEVEIGLLAQRSASNDDEQLANDTAVYQTRHRHEQLRKGYDAAMGFDAPEEHLQRMATDLDTLAERLEQLREAGGILDDERASLEAQEATLRSELHNWRQLHEQWTNANPGMVEDDLAHESVYAALEQVRVAYGVRVKVGLRLRLG